MKQLFGLVVCGGKSSRMGEDKSLLNYYGIPQRYYLYEMLELLCEKVFISCNHDQAKTIDRKYNFIVDTNKYQGIGPMAALLSAFDSNPDVSFLTVGCDYPFITKDDLKKLAEARNKSSWAVSYFNEKENIREPLLAVYENSCYSFMKINFIEKKYSLRYFLEEINALKISPKSPEIFTSVNTKGEYQNVLKIIAERKN